MTPEDHEPGLDPVDEERVRRLLAAAAPGPEPMPEDVAARLDTVLAGLAAERDATTTPQDPGPARTGPSGGDDLARRRTVRRRRLAGAVLAAAAVVAVVVTVRPVLTGSSGGASSAGSASTAAKAPAGGDLLGPGAEGLRGFRSFDVTGARPRLSSADLAAGVRRLADRNPRRTGSPEAPRRYSCSLPAARRDADLIAVLLDGRPATLVLTPGTAGTRVALVYACDDGTTPVARLTVPSG